ncbi:hypothetical protein [[Mycobacterium] vasticus]|uniref:PE-PGRS family protein n=1 Tax=[Mycobacterium] vasticus TaxID=2875777 RepID=A0ABU5Z1W0_9MYCO|nr:hypothetical protein [Mycolicibacter sp. MYC017]MEB3071382.1 hypothetical protein [Mycolicibacter sp. MYC017]
MRITCSPPLATAGVGLAVAGLLVAPPSAAPHVPSVAAQSAVQLTAAFDDLSWTQVFDNASAALTSNVSGPFAGAPFPALEQVVLNWAGYLGDLYKDLATGNYAGIQATSTAIAADIADHLAAAHNAPMVPFDPTGSASYLLPSLDNAPISLDFSACAGSLCLSPSIDLGGHAALLNDFINGLPIDLDLGKLGTIHFGTINILSDLLGSSLAGQVLPYLEFMGSPLSGVLWGMVGANLSPMAQLLDDGMHIYQALTAPAPDYTTALADLGAIPANVTNAYLEGYGNLGNLLSDLGIADGGFQLDLGGLLSPAGSFFNALGFDFGVSSSTDILGVTWSASANLVSPAMEVGPLASLLEMGQAIAQSVGWNDVGSQLADLAGQF